MGIVAVDLAAHKADQFADLLDHVDTIALVLFHIAQVEVLHAVAATPGIGFVGGAGHVRVR
jgi:hypothetical protein